MTGKEQDRLKKGLKIGVWVRYWDNGRIDFKGTYKDRYREGFWVDYYENGTTPTGGVYMHGRDGLLFEIGTGTYKDGAKVK